MRLTSFSLCGAMALGCAACSHPGQSAWSSDPPQALPPLSVPTPPQIGVPTVSEAGPPFAGPGPSADGGGTPRLAPDQMPAPIQGGTLLLTRDGKAVVSDPDRDRVVIVDVAGLQVLATIALQRGDEPGRAVEDDAGRVHVVLRRAGQIATLDMAHDRIVQRTDVCSMPSGIVFEAGTELLHVACSDGQLVSLPAAGGDVTRRVRVDSDLRDVLIVKGKLMATRFKTAELLELSADGSVAARRKPAQMVGPLVESSLGTFTTEVKRFDAAVAWRTVAAPDGRLVMVHQRGQVDPIVLHGQGGDVQRRGAPTATPVPLPVAGAGSAGDPPVFTKVAAGVPRMGPGGSGGSPYGSGLGCDSIVESGVSYFGDSGDVSGPVMPSAVLPVDAAVSPDGRWLAIATPGSFESRTGNSMPFSVMVMPMGVVPKPDDTPLMDPSSAAQASGEPFGGGKCLLPTRDMPGQLLNPGQVVAVAFDAQGHLVMQTRDPNQLLVTQIDPNVCSGCEAYDSTIQLGGVERRDLGHDTFHLNAGGGLACASCHPGGGDDGRTWDFAGIGPRRTQLFNMGVRDTLPLHWDGEFANMNELLLDVFVQRMGGQTLGLNEAEGLEDYVEALHPNTPLRPAGDAAAARGKMLFESKEVGCADCHNGAKFTNNKTVDVGTGGMFQVPSLIGVVYHQPYMHNGCAMTLHDRFAPGCGGAMHGHPEGLSPDQVNDVIAYLESL